MITQTDLALTEALGQEFYTEIRQEWTQEQEAALDALREYYLDEAS